MSYSAAAIRRAFRDVLEGAVGSGRTVPSNTYEYGAFEGLTEQAIQAKCVAGDRGLLSDPPHRFDVKLGRLRTHESSPVGAIGTARHGVVDVEIQVWTHSVTTVQETERDTLLARVHANGDVAIQALNFPGNLTATAAAAATSIVSGVMVGPGGEGAPEVEIVSEQWEANLVRSRIAGSVIVYIAQP